jgi:hypothetical protein
MKNQISSLILLLCAGLNAQNPVSVGAGSVAEFPPTSVYEEGAYFGKPYRELKNDWPWHIHPDKIGEPVPTNDWWTATIFEPYTGNLEVYPQRVEGTSSGIKVSSPTDFVMQGDRGVGVVFDSWVTIKGTVDVEQSGNTDVFADFETENYPAGWTVTGNAPYPGPVSLSQLNQTPLPNGFLGDSFINSFNGDAPQMTLTSPSFTIEKDYIYLLVGGGNNPDASFVGLYINGERVFNETGENSASMTWRQWDVSGYAGQTAEIRIVDNTSGGWGFIMCDNIVFSNLTAVGSSFTNSFWPNDAKALQWSDLGFTFRMEDDNGNLMDGSVFHGVPYTWVDITGIDPVLQTSHPVEVVYNAMGNLVEGSTFPGSSLFFSVNGKLFGVHAPDGATFNLSESGEWIPQMNAGTPHYLVISVIPDVSLIPPYEQYARNKITGSRFEWDYQPSSGEIITTFEVETQNLEGLGDNEPTLMSFLPHHYRDTDHPSFIANADYESLIGVMHSAVGTGFDFHYDFGGMPPYMPQPLNLSSEKEQRLNDLITTRVEASEGAFNGNTYAKGLNEYSNIMLMAKELDHPGFEAVKANLKNELINWLTYDPSEADEGGYFFARYPNFGALIGFPSGYGSQAFNDLHFHYGYFVIGAARLMLVDDQFKARYGEVVKEIAKSYANWKRYGENDDSKLPTLRNFDPYMGHSWAGGVGNGGDGNNQESTSEAMNSWFGIYLLGVALEDHEITSLGATGFMLEGTATADYWFNRNGDLPETYPFNYVGILKANNLAMATYCSGDPAWAFGIQCVPSDFYYNHYLADDAALAALDFEAMLEDRVAFASFDNNGVYENISDMGAYLGGYILNYIKTYDPEQAADLLDQLYDTEGGEWTSHVNAAVNYYLAHANMFYGRPADGYHTSIASGSVYENPQTGEITYMVYNHSNAEREVDIYKNGSIMETILVGPRQFYNSALTNQKPVAIAGEDQIIQSPDDSVTLNGQDSYDQDGEIVSYQWSVIEGNAAFIVSPESNETVVEDLVPGNYVFNLTITDDGGAYISDNVSVTVLANPNEVNLALEKPVTVSSNQPGFTATSVNDGDITTRWSSEVEDPQWVIVDLGQSYNLRRVELEWEAAYGSAYEIHFSDVPNFDTYSVIAEVVGGDGDSDVIAVDNNISGRYLRLYATQRGTVYGYSLFEIEAYGSDDVTTLANTNKDDLKCYLFPVPAGDFVNVMVDEESFYVQVFDLDGNLVLRSEEVLGMFKLQLTELSGGLYIMEVVSGKKSTFKKLIVK